MFAACSWAASCALTIALQLEALGVAACSETPLTVASKSTLFALTAYHCGAKPWSEAANVVGLPPIRSRAIPSFSSASS